MVSYDTLCMHTINPFILTCFFCKIQIALVITEQRCYAGRKKKRPTSPTEASAGARSAEQKYEPMTVHSKSVVSGIVTRIDLLEYISNIEDEDD